MAAIIGFLLLSVLCACVGGVHGECRHVNNEDLIEYTCVGGHPSDLNALPAATGKIRIMNMRMPRITADTFSRFGSDLWVLSCSHCEIEDIEPGAFLHLDNLQQLSLDNNYLTRVQESWFEGLDYLTYLDLNYNNIENIEDGVFSALPSLVDLRLSGNRMECLNLQDLSHLTSLRRIFLSEIAELKCPNAISQFLEDRGVSFERDPEWNRLPTDLINVEVPGEDETSSKEEVTQLPAYRERLHLTPSTPPTEEPRTMHSSTRYYPTEEIFYSTELVSPIWIEVDAEDNSYTTSSPEPTTQRSRENTMRPAYEPPKTVSPPEAMYPPYVTTARNLPETTERSWPVYQETSTQTAVYPPQENENKHYESPTSPSRKTRPPFLAGGPIYHEETSSSFAEQDMDRTTDPYRSYWIPNQAGISSATGYPLEDDYLDYTDVDTESPEEMETHVVRPAAPSVPEEFQPSSPDDFFQAPYYEPTVTIRPPPPLENYQQRQEETTLEVLSIETTTDKPLPECPNGSTSQSIEQSFHLIIGSILLILMRHILVEGF